MSRPFAVVHLAQRGEQLGARISVHRQDRSKVLAQQESEFSDLLQQPTSGGFVLVAIRSAREQRGLGERCGGEPPRHSFDALKNLSLSTRWRADNEEPRRVSRQHVCREGSEN